MDYNKKLQEVLEEIGVAKKMVLATSIKDIVSARTVSIIYFEGKFYFQTDATMDKAKEIAQNPNVALSFDGVQIRGICKEVGHPLIASNEKFLNLFKEKYSNAYSKYSHLDNERVFEVTPRYIKVWKYIEDTPHIEILDCENERYNLIKYQI